MTQKQRLHYRYSNSFKRSIVEAIEKEGLSLESARHRYGIGGSSTIQSWIRKFGKNELLNKVVEVKTLEERDELTRLRAENKQLKIAYAELALKHKLSESVIETSDEMFGTDLKKKYVQELSKNTNTKKK